MRPCFQALATAALTFALTIAMSLGSNTLLSFLSLAAGFLLLFFVIVIGVLFDILGVAVAAGQETPFHAMASNRVPGGRQAIWLVRNASRVATFASDVIGDIAGTLSGAISATMVLRLLLLHPGLGERILTAVMIAAVAACTVGGKAFGKTLAIHHTTAILLLAGRVLFYLEKIGIRVTPNGRQKKNNRMRSKKGKWRPKTDSR